LCAPSTDLGRTGTDEDGETSATDSGQRCWCRSLAEPRHAPLTPLFDGHGYCFLETRTAKAALVQGAFFAEPEPHVAIGDISAAHAAERRQFEADRLTRWFGR